MGFTGYAGRAPLISAAPGLLLLLLYDIYLRLQETKGNFRN
jgi:hypothetical protein